MASSRSAIVPTLASRQSGASPRPPPRLRGTGLRVDYAHQEWAGNAGAAGARPVVVEDREARRRAVGENRAARRRDVRQNTQSLVEHEALRNKSRTCRRVRLGFRMWLRAPRFSARKTPMIAGSRSSTKDSLSMRMPIGRTTIDFWKERGRKSQAESTTTPKRILLPLGI